MLKNKYIPDYNKMKQDIARYEAGYRILNKWLLLRRQGKSIVKYFEENQIKSIAIYGWGDLGKHLKDELKESSVEVKYGIDRMAAQMRNEEFLIIGLEEISHQEKVDAIVVTPVQHFWKIEQDLAEITSTAIVCLEDVIDY